MKRSSIVSISAMLVTPFAHKNLRRGMCPIGCHRPQICGDFLERLPGLGTEHLTQELAVFGFGRALVTRCPKMRVLGKRRGHIEAVISGQLFEAVQPVRLDAHITLHRSRICKSGGGRCET